MSLDRSGSDTPVTTLTKSERGRLKKLRRRASVGDDNTSSSSSGGSKTGILTNADYIEISGLLSRSGSDSCSALKLGPSVLVSNRPGYVEEDFTSPDRWQQTSGADHRDIILSLLFHDGTQGSSVPNNTGGVGKKGKRKRNGSNDGSPSSAKQPALASLPSWARLHNPACADGLVVVEFSVSASASLEALMPSKRILDRPKDNNPCIIHNLLSRGGLHGRRAVPFATRLFQGDKPRHMTDVLLYTDLSSQEQQKSITVADSKNGNTTNHDLHSTTSILESFVLKRKDRRKERYPCEVIEKKKPPKKKRHKMTEAELAAEQRKVDRKAAKQKIENTIAGRLPSFLTNIATDEQSKKCSELFGGAFSQEEAIDLVQKLEVQILGQEDYTSGEMFIPTFISQSQASSVSVFAMDCEMVETSAGRELARVTLIRFQPTEQNADGYQVVLDLLVKPVRPVLDYKTQYSGITAAMLEPITTRIEQVQVALASIVGINDILLGHSLENDLRALCLVHDKVVDTALLFRTESGARKHCEFPFILHLERFGIPLLFALTFFNLFLFYFLWAALKHLSSVLLKRKIQAGCGSSGHCSEEDAAAALLLALNRARIGDSFRLYDRPRRKNTIEEVTMLRRKNVFRAATLSDDRVSRASICQTDAPIVVLGPDEWLKAHFTSSRSSAHALRCENINSATSGALVAWLTSRQRQANLIWANLVVDEKDAGKAQANIDEVMVSFAFPRLLFFAHPVLSST